MDWLTFISSVISGVAWPSALVIGLLVFRKPVASAILSLKRLKYKDLEVELVAPQEAGEQELSAIVSYLQRSPHSFQWFRDNTEFQYTDADFELLVARHSEVLQRVTIASKDETKRPGLRLTTKGKEMIRKALN